MTRHTEQAFLLRLWRDYDGAPLRTMLITVAAPQRSYHFASLDELQMFLLAQSGPEPSNADDGQGSPASSTNYSTP